MNEGRTVVGNASISDVAMDNCLTKPRCAVRMQMFSRQQAKQHERTNGQSRGDALGSVRSVHS